MELLAWKVVRWARSPIISPRHVFNPAEAEEQRIMIERLSAFFSVSSFPITFYSYAGPADLYAAKVSSGIR